MRRQATRCFSDFAIFKALGMLRRQVSAITAWQASTLTGLALVTGEGAACRVVPAGPTRRAAALPGFDGATSCCISCPIRTLCTDETRAVRWKGTGWAGVWGVAL